MSRESLEALFDEDHQAEMLNKIKGLTIWKGLVHGKHVIVAEQNFEEGGAAIAQEHGAVYAGAVRSAMELKCPFLSVNSSVGADIRQGIRALSGVGQMLKANTDAQGIIPQIAVMAGPCAGGAAYAPGLMDFIFMIRDKGKMFITGPDVIKKVTGEVIDIDDLGGVSMHCRVSGVAHAGFDSLEQCFLEVRELLSLLPPSAEASRKRKKNFSEALDAPTFTFHLPPGVRKGYDVKELVESIFDRGSFFEIRKEYARMLVTGFARLGGETVGILANNPACLAGVLDCASSRKASELIAFCGCFHIPIVSLTDVTGFLPGIDQEKEGIIREGSRMIRAFIKADTMKINVLLRRSYGGAYIAMNSMEIAADRVYCWPKALIAVMGAESAAEVLYKKRLALMSPQERLRFESEKIHELGRMEEENLKTALEEKLVNAVIEPEETRKVLIEAFAQIEDWRFAGSKEEK